MVIVSQSQSYPVGPSWRGGVWNFAVFSRHAEGMEICFFDPSEPAVEVLRVRMSERTGDVWHVALEGVSMGWLYGLRAYGAWNPGEGHMFHPSRLLLDPYARAVAGDYRWHTGMGVWRAPGEVGDEDNGGSALKGVVTPLERRPFGEEYGRLRTAWEKTVIYETHVRGLTMVHPGVPEHLRGTYAGLTHPEVLDWLRSIGVTAVQLLPVHMHVDDEFLGERGLTNYWGYNSLGFFAPHPEYGAEKSGVGLVEEFRVMARALHAAGIELILDVVYNHTAEGGEGGPILAFRGLDNAVYYRSLPGDGFVYHDTTGCGNTVHVADPAVLQLVLDSLRYWVEEMGVDGFRFDLATALGRVVSDFQANAPFFQAIQQDPVLSRVKLIAEPWDVGWGGYQMGAYPAPWAELNGQYRDNVRGFWKGDCQTVPELATRLTGSRELFEHNHRGPMASVNMITSHDGFTLRDLVSYNDKHNEGNLEGNRDGDSHNVSWNSGAEGELADETVQRLRRRRARNMMATVFCSLGVPMLREGDELYLSKGGNNNSYCHDSGMNWLDWSAREREDGKNMAAFVGLLARFRAGTAALRRGKFIDAPETAKGWPEVLWLTADGRPMTGGCWRNKKRRHLGVLLSCGDDQVPNEVTNRAAGAVLLWFNSNDMDLEFTLPEFERGAWTLVFDTRYETGVPERDQTFQAGSEYGMLSWSMAAFVPESSPEHQMEPRVSTALFQPVKPLQ